MACPRARNLTNAYLGPVKEANFLVVCSQGDDGNFSASNVDLFMVLLESVIDDGQYIVRAVSGLGDVFEREDDSIVSRRADCQTRDLRHGVIDGYDNLCQGSARRPIETNGDNWVLCFVGACQGKIRG